MKFRIEFTTLPPVEVEIDIALVEAFAMHYCQEHGYDPSTGKGPMPLQIQRIPDELAVIDQAYSCPECGSTEVTSKMENQRFPYGDRDVWLEAVVPVRTCGACGFQWLDADAEDARDEAVRKYGLTQPKR